MQLLQLWKNAFGFCDEAQEVHLAQIRLVGSQEHRDDVKNGSGQARPPACLHNLSRGHACKKRN
jgi:hypothetical protein